MINCSKCKKWFYYTCVDLDPDTKIRGSWLCITPPLPVEKLSISNFSFFGAII